MTSIPTRDAQYARGTELRRAGPFDAFVGGRALCSDGQVRPLRYIADYADTYFSVPAAVRVKGRDVSGFVCVETEEGWTTPTEDDPAVVKFVASNFGANADALPRGAHIRPPAEPTPTAGLEKLAFIVSGIGGRL